MPKISPYLKPFLRLLELILVVFIVVKLADYSIEAEQAALPQDWRSQIGAGFAQVMLAFLILLVYFVVWNVRIIKTIRQESQRKAKFLNIGLICLFPGLFAMALVYWQIQKEGVKKQAESYLAPVSYREIFRTPNKLTGIRGFRPSPDSLLILTWKSKVIDPHKIYRTEDEEVRGQSFNQEPIENSEELFSLKNGQLKLVAVQHEYTQFREYHFKVWAKCLQAFINRNQESKIYRYDNCTQKHHLTPFLTGFRPGYRSKTTSYEVGRELFFLTEPLHPESNLNNSFYVGRITDSEAKVYRIDLGEDRQLKKEFKDPYSSVQLFATTQNIYLVTRFRILEFPL